MAYLFLAISIVGELIGTSMLKASEGFTRLYPTLFTIVAFVISFFFISLSLKTLPLNMTYAIWSGVGAVATTLISVLIWKEKINTGSIAGIALIVIGVVVLNLFGAGHGEAKATTEATGSIVQK
ncbi:MULTISPECIES: DMT family transporter [Paenibacillus]|jgi:small multidrug resistance pump|uniref:Quaternary ammonium transporter n=2 Tax=Paenibacillus TaxID=44249 RepID=A0ABX2ZI71_PAEPO|nr:MULTISPECIES: multidrug efflux SMR transporter [Paenibacillus]AIW42349.1 quaternary ammonium transporter [Paenibacillus polymyxa CR1]APQ61898.1 quaternary ammonium transporter [Paenibacillus polymyxa]MCP3745441.1 multidrug efflux SMR transporter [Paenibacillus sp. A3M_27_13]MDR6778424.1 small multidrug resistance pump [Paenibacillus peoriae]ODA10044.1 quaternary ammonium transporter [Paenibacillus polymyxa]